MKLYQNASSCGSYYITYHKLIIIIPQTNKVSKAKNETFQCEQRECLLMNFGNEASNPLKKFKVLCFWKKIIIIIKKMFTFIFECFKFKFTRKSHFFVNSVYLLKEKDNWIFSNKIPFSISWKIFPCLRLFESKKYKCLNFLVKTPNLKIIYR